MTDMNEIIRDTLTGRQAERNKRFADHHTAHVEERMRQRYFGAFPGATEEGFRRALPELREAMRRRAVVDGETGGAGSGVVG